MRNTVGENGLSAAKMVFGQEMRSVLPSITASLLKERKKNYYNQHSKTLPDLCINQRVRVQDEETKRWNKTGTIVQIGKHRQYLVELVNGRKLWRNRKFLRLILREETFQEVDRSGGNIVRRKPPNPVRRLTPHEVNGSHGNIVRRKPPKS